MNFQSILDRLRVPYHTEGRYCRPGWIQFHCPFCTGGRDPNKPYAGYHLGFGYVHCWRCGPHNTTKAIQLLGGLTWSESLALSGELDSERRPDVVHSGTLKIPKGIEPLAPAHLHYLKQRGFDPDELQRLWRIKGIGIASKLQWRIWIPIYFHGELVSWTTRSLTNEEPRYVSAATAEESIPHKSLLYGEDFCTTAISIHEGPFDVWRVGPGAVATLGTQFTPAQINRMSRYALRIVCFDSEDAAQKRAKRLCDELSVLSEGETINVVLDAKDAGEASQKEIRQLQQMLN